MSFSFLYRCLFWTAILVAPALAGTAPALAGTMKNRLLPAFFAPAKACTTKSSFLCTTRRFS
jgi:hypothetical protein